MNPATIPAGDPFGSVLGPLAPLLPGPWGTPLPLNTRIDGEPYPVEALPPIIGAAVEEVRAYVQAPVALVACSALSALSLAGQGLVDVERDPRLVGPAALYLLTVADSGERKSTCDGYFAAAIADWERDEAERLAPAVEAAGRARAIWAAKRAGLLEKIKVLAKSESPGTFELERALAALGREPADVRVPVLRHTDATPEALGHVLATEWPSGGVVSSEAAVVLGGHGMSSDTITRNLGLLNTLWDGGEHRVRRRTSDSFTVRGARLTVALMTQPATLRDFMAKSGDLSRGTGFLARFLVAAPPSTQGLRLYRSPPTEWPALDGYRALLRELLDTPLTWNGGGLVPPRLTFMADAKVAWAEAFNEVEGKLRDGGDFADVRDVASKTLDNAARLAGLFHLVEQDPGGAIGKTNVLRGVALAFWHLNEARSVLNGVAPPPRVLDAERLEGWLFEWIERGGRPGTREARQSGPVREGVRFEAALALLTDSGRARVQIIGRQKLIELNPALDGGEE